MSLIKHAKVSKQEHYSADELARWIFKRLFKKAGKKNTKFLHKEEVSSEEVSPEKVDARLIQSCRIIIIMKPFYLSFINSFYVKIVFFLIVLSGAGSC